MVRVTLARPPKLPRPLGSGTLGRRRRYSRRWTRGGWGSSTERPSTLALTLTLTLILIDRKAFKAAAKGLLRDPTLAAPAAQLMQGLPSRSPKQTRGRSEEETQRLSQEVALASFLQTPSGTDPHI